MGTLTAGVPLLAEHCPHKLPTSCRLTARPICCACQDERPHAASYSVYVDGVGFVQRGTRWQGYCWFCKEFWNNRVAAANLRPAQTRIPEVPDQTDFLNRWYEFHRGYRTVTRGDGAEDKIAVLGEPLMEVSPGCLPRTLDELRTGRAAALGTSSLPQRDEAAIEALEQPVESIEDAIGALLDEADSDDQQESVEHGHLVETGNLSIGDLSSEIETLRAERRQRQAERRQRRLHSLNPANRTDSGSVTAQTHSSSRGVMSRPFRLADDLDQREHAVTRTLLHARTAQREAQDLIRVCENALSNIDHDRRTMENNIRVFGTREEMESQGEEYQSPISGMFNRAWDRYRQAEEQRRNPQDEAVEAIQANDDQITEGIASFYYKYAGYLDMDEVRRVNSSGWLRHVGGNPAMAAAFYDRIEFLRPPEDYPPSRELFGMPRPEVAGRLLVEDQEITNLVHSAYPRIFRPFTNYDNRMDESTLEEFERMSIESQLTADFMEQATIDYESFQVHQPIFEQDPRGLDDDASRPAGKTDEEMTFKLECKICYSQPADTAVLPCGHMVMCRWCAAVQMPGRPNDHTQPQRPSSCPSCRKKVTKIVKIYI